MGYREDCMGWYEGEQGHSYRPRHVSRPPCGERRWPGSHIECVLHVDHAEDDILHESAEGDQWPVVDPDAEERAELRLLAALLPLGARPVPL